MRLLTHYTPADPRKGATDAEPMAKMGTFMQASINSGVLIATGGVMPSAANGMRIKMANGEFDVAAGCPSDVQQAGGWAILNVNSPEHLKEVARQFLEAAGDGDIQVMEITQVPIPLAPGGSLQASIRRNT
jgi:hypothetical protein